MSQNKEAVNDSAKLVAQALELIDGRIDMGEYTWVKTESFDKAVENLFQALEKLSGTI